MHFSIAIQRQFFHCGFSQDYPPCRKSWLSKPEFMADLQQYTRFPQINEK